MIYLVQMWCKNNNCNMRAAIGQEEGGPEEQDGYANFIFSLRHTSQQEPCVCSCPRHTNLKYTVQYSTVQYSTVQYTVTLPILRRRIEVCLSIENIIQNGFCTVYVELQYCTVQYSTVLLLNINQEYGVELIIENIILL